MCHAISGRDIAFPRAGVALPPAGVALPRAGVALPRAGFVFDELRVNSLKQCSNIVKLG